MMRRKEQILLLVGFLCGVLGGSLVIDGLWVVLASFFSCCIVVLSGIFCDCRERRVKIFGIFLLGVLIGVMRFLVSFGEGENHVKNYVGWGRLEGVICEEVDVRKDKVKYTVEVLRLFDGEDWKDVRGKILVNSERYPVYEYGDRVLVEGKIELPEGIEDFRYDRYLSRYGIYAVIYRGRILEVKGNEGWRFFRKIFWLKGVFEDGLMRIFAEPHGSFMAGLILGSRKGIPDSLMEEFNTTGLTHIIAISGYNITLLIVIVGGIFGMLGRRKKIILSSVFIFCFVILVGASAAVVRAGIMGVISLIALWFGRQYLVGLALLWTAVIMVGLNPQVLVYDVGFQLSFLATMGLIFVSPHLEKYFTFLPEKIGIKESVLMTISAQILALPVIIYNFGRLSIVSVLANICVLPFIPLAMFSGFFAVVGGLVSLAVGSMFGFIGYAILEIIIWLVGVFASVKFASIDLEYFAWWMMMAYYLILVKKVFRTQKSG